jgi:AcrR family transcriptional regulator
MLYIQFKSVEIMARRQYLSATRNSDAEENRRRVLAAASATLGAGDISQFSLDLVARRAKVTRLTLYNQFGSRRGLLEAVFDERARLGGLGRIAEAMAMTDARGAFVRIIAIFCDFWDSDASLGKLHAATALDAEFARALAERNERRRKLFSVLVERMAGDASAARKRDAVDLMFVLTSQPTYAALRSGRSKRAACELIKEACAAAIQGLQARKAGPTPT